MRAIFTTHAFDRVYERLALTSDEIATILNYDLAVPIGREQGTSRVHRLFYSHPDMQCFIAVQDERTGEVITILPIDFGAWKVSDDAQREAMRLLSADRNGTRPPTSPSPAPDTRTPVAEVTPSRFIFSAILRLPDGQYLTQTIGGIPITPTRQSVAMLSEDPTVISWVLERLREKQLQRVGAMVYSCIVRAGRRGTPTPFEVPLPKP